MCGIAGVFNLNDCPIEEKDASLITRALEKMKYRGPDHTGTYRANSVFMGNVRLAIQGLESMSNQPVFNEDKSVAVVFNGEIYNYPELKVMLINKGHIFSTRTDTEVLVHLYEEYGEGLCNFLNGMYAFAIHDTVKNSITLGRDRFGQKPLFMIRRDEKLVFCSELKAMLDFISPKIDVESSRNFLSLGYFIEPDNIISGVTSLRPGGTMVLSAQGYREFSLEHEWDFVNGPPVQSMDEWLEVADGSFKQAVLRHTLSDVPIALYLSGGIDSSLIAVCLKELNFHPTAFTGCFVDEESHNEYPYSKHLTDVLGLKLRTVEMTNDCLADAMDSFLQRSSQPQGDYSGLPSFVLAENVSKDFKVVLGGDGGDELFSGYPTYLLPELNRKFRWIPKKMICWGAEFFKKFGNNYGYLPLKFRLQLLSQAWGQTPARAHCMVKDFLPPVLAAGILNKDIYGEMIAKLPAADAFESIFSRVSKGFESGANEGTTTSLNRLDFYTFLSCCTIPKMERNSMLFSLENRLPFLDNEILSLANRTPQNLKVQRNKGKACLRTLLASKLGQNWNPNPRKQGFGPPLQKILSNQLKSWARDMVHQPHPAFAKNSGDNIEKFLRQGWDLHRTVWIISVFKDWTIRNRIGF